jgi:CheY-like chemotaxis protein
MRILIVDDNQLDMMVTRQLLQHESVFTTCTTKVNEALQLINEQPFDLVITDFDMHPYTGRTILEGARAAQPNIPVWCVSGSVDETDQTEFFTGFSEVFTKPLDYEAFRAFFSHYCAMAKTA